VAREVRQRAGLASGGPGGHVEVQLVDGDGQNRSGHVRRWAGSSIQCLREVEFDSWLWKLHRGTQRLSRGSDGAGNG
jgi:hypothetical protein